MQLTIHDISKPLGDIGGLLKDVALGGLSLNGLFRSPKGLVLSLTGVPQRGVELPLLFPMDSIEPLDLYECCLFKVPVFEESSLELFDFRLQTNIKTIKVFSMKK